MIEASFVAYLESRPGLTSLVASRIYPLVAPKDAARPLILYGTPDVERQYAQAGDVGPTTRTIDVWCMCDRYQDARLVAEQIRLAVSGFRGRWGEDVVKLCRIVGERDRYYPPESDQEQGAFAVWLTLSVQHSETRVTW